MADGEVREAHLEIHFRDPKPPHEIQFQLETELVTLFQPHRDGALLLFRGEAKSAGCPYWFELRFDAALLMTSCYTLRIDASWEKLPAEYSDYFRRTTE